MTDEQKNSIRFYTTNDYLLINGILWEENDSYIDDIIKIINADGLAVMHEAEEQGYDVRWKCSKEDGLRLFKIYQDRFPAILNENTKIEIINRARQDIQNILSCMTPLTESMSLFRNIKAKFINTLQVGEILDYKGFSSCSMQPHLPQNATFGTKNCTLFEIEVSKGTPAIRLDLMPDIANEADEIILPPIKFLITKIEQENNKVYMKCLNEYNK
ncbi:MAG: ADP-ribosyltransferase [Anaeroplasmataceae bacterium]|nr:ADP-ribosyltransferase [Anaeroplasmataceae bacterium]